jgi:hypothetical protein
VPVVDRVAADLDGQVRTRRVLINAPERWDQVFAHYKVGRNIPLLVLYAHGRRQRILQGLNPASVVREFATAQPCYGPEGEYLPTPE